MSPQCAPVRCDRVHNTSGLTVATEAAQGLAAATAALHYCAGRVARATGTPGRADYWRERAATAWAVN